MKKTQKPRHQDASYIGGGDLDSQMFWFGDLNVFGAFPSAPTVYQKPRSNVFYMTRNWFERQVFLKAMTLLKFDLYNYGFQLTASPLPRSASKADKKEWAKQTEKIQAWHNDHELAVASFVRDAWGEWLIQDNAVAVWCKNCAPVLHPVEHLTYNDDFGIETLNFTHGLSAEKIKSLPGITSEIRSTMTASSDLTLQKQGKARSNPHFDFVVQKRTRVGMGLAWPQLRTLFSTAAQWENLELGDWQMAEALRTVYELHLIGHEIKNGNRAGMPDHFMKAKRFAAINKILKGDKQLMATVKRLVVNFDHRIEYPRIDPKHFGKERYESALERLTYWAMPIAQMLFAKQVNPWHGQFLRAKANTERYTYMGPFINKVLVECLGAPKGTHASWSDDLFLDPRLLLDILKTGLTSGPLSQGTFLQKTGFSADEERARKDEENELPSHQTRPIWDGSHGINPNDPEAGRPPGVGDKGPRKKA